MMLARDSVFTLAQRGLTALQVGETLQADLVLTGNLSALPSHFRLRAEMIRVSDGTEIWVEDILVAKEQIAGLETELAQRLSFRMGSERVSISASEGQKAIPQHREAYEIFQRARYEWQTLQRHRMQDGLQHLSKAVELDPGLISAKVDLVHLCGDQPRIRVRRLWRDVAGHPAFCGAAASATHSGRAGKSRMPPGAGEWPFAPQRRRWTLFRSPCGSSSVVPTPFPARRSAPSPPGCLQPISQCRH